MSENSIPKLDTESTAEDRNRIATALGRLFNPNRLGIYSSRQDIEESLIGATEHDLFKATAERGVCYVGNLRSFTEIDQANYHWTFANIGLWRLTRSVRGETGKVSRNSFVMLDIGSMLSNPRMPLLRHPEHDYCPDVFRLRVASGGPHYLFTPKVVEDDDGDISERTILTEGLFEYLNATEDMKRESESLIKIISEESPGRYDRALDRSTEASRRSIAEMKARSRQ